MRGTGPAHTGFMIMVVIAAGVGGAIGWLIDPKYVGPGALVGIVGLIVGIGLWELAQTWLIIGVPPAPPCRKGCCTYKEYKRCYAENEVLYVCQTGDQYIREGRRFMQIMPDGTREPYMIWKPLRKWDADA